MAARVRLRAGEFEAAIHWTGSGPGGHSGFLGEASATGYERKGVTDLLYAAGLTVNLDELDAIYDELDQIVRSDLPVTFLFPELKVSVAHRRIRGLESPSRANPLFHMEDLWIDEN